MAVAAGIFLSRIAGLVRERVIAHYLGLSPAAAAFRAALRIPNLLQNLLGEGVLSASFIPVYARLLAEGRIEEASRVARAIGTLLALSASGVAALGVLAADPLVELLAPGFDDATRALTVRLVQILFPGTALLVMSAWCLGVLNSHRRFFLSYVSPVLWNAALIGAAIAAGRRLAGHDDDLARWIAYGAVIGSAAQFLVQLPAVIRLLRGVRPSLDVKHDGVRQTLRAFVPVLLGRGSVQISAYVDQILASFLGEAIVAAMFNAQTCTSCRSACSAWRSRRRSCRRWPGPSATPRRARATCRRGSPARSGASCSSSCRRRWRSWRSEDRSSRSCSRPGGSARARPSSCGSSSPAPRSGSWRARRAGCSRRRSTRSAIRRRPCAWRSCA